MVEQKKQEDKTVRLSEAVLTAASENVKTVAALEEGVKGLDAAVVVQGGHINDILRAVESGVSALAHFSDESEKVSSAIDGAANAAQRGRAQVELLAKDASVLSSQAVSGGAFLGDIATRFEELYRTVQAIKDAAEHLSVISINTAIEAARAGEKGKGFSVIAREVRSLADRSGELSESIERGLSDISKGLEEARGASAAAVASAQSVSETTRRFSQEFSSITEGTDRAKHLVSGFGSLIEDSLKAERLIQDGVKSIAEEGQFIKQKSDTTEALAKTLTASTAKVLEALGSVRTSRHERALDEARLIATSLSKVDLIDRSALDRALAGSLQGSRAFELLYVMDAKGVQVSSNVADPSCGGASKGYGENRSAKPYFEEPARTREVYVSRAYLSSATGSLCITASVPLFSPGGEFVGVFAADLDASGLGGESACA